MKSNSIAVPTLKMNCHLQLNVQTCKGQIMMFNSAELFDLGSMTHEASKAPRHTVAFRAINFGPFQSAEELHHRMLVQKEEIRNILLMPQRGSSPSHFSCLDGTSSEGGDPIMSSLASRVGSIGQNVGVGWLTQN